MYKMYAVSIFTDSDIVWNPVGFQKLGNIDGP